jgi:hypothetical protein
LIRARPPFRHVRKIAFITCDVYCARCGRAAGWPCRYAKARRTRRAQSLTKTIEPLDTLHATLVAKRTKLPRVTFTAEEIRDILAAE